MKKNILDSVKKTHLIGIGGTGMSGLAKLLLDIDKKVSGSDNVLSPVLKQLAGKGVKIFCPQKAANVSAGKTELVIYSHAIFPDNPEYKKTIECRIPMLTYPEAVGCLMEKRRGIAVAGTHGKTTTSSLVVSILRKAGYSPSFLLGGEIKGLGNSGVGGSELLVVEACEYKRSFLNYNPETAIITNIEEDHLDYYRDINDIKDAFLDFAGNVRGENGTVVYCADDANVSDIARKLKKENTVSYGLKNGGWTARNINFMKGTSKFDCFFEGKKCGSVKLGISGMHNVQNSLAAIACARHLGVPWNGIKEGLSGFKGVHRRCELLGKKKGVTVMDDYGHHPTEIMCTLECVKKMFPESRLIVVFQPHQYSRTRFLLKEFALSFSAADKVVVPDIYFVRDSIMEKKLVNAQILVEKIRKNGREALYLPAFEEITEYLYEIVKPGDVVLTIGAGPVNKVAEDLLARLAEK
ncbi:MAG: UDP-N-acetylmuramate--L-alanine ligase [Candidatus Omnitrophica bacterium]|nr:UDP-N-acetylmuramate--L-alanine ligase [Candidatus Omnitrophota bacterium]